MHFVTRTCFNLCVAVAVDCVVAQSQRVFVVTTALMYIAIFAVFTGYFVRCRDC